MVVVLWQQYDFYYCNKININDDVDNNYLIIIIIIIIIIILILLP